MTEREEENLDMPCSVCYSKEAYDCNCFILEDDIIFCDLCNMATHPSCYGGEQLYEKNDDEQSWFCERCAYIKKHNLTFDDIQCFLCPELKGTIKRVQGNLWAHINCIELNPQIHYCDPLEKKEAILIKQFEKLDLKSKCDICSISLGSTLKCPQKNCNSQFHVTCGLQNGLIPAYYEDISSFLKNDNYQFFCNSNQYHKTKIQNNIQKLYFKKNKERLSYKLSIKSIQSPKSILTSQEKFSSDISTKDDQIKTNGEKENYSNQLIQNQLKFEEQALEKPKNIEKLKDKVEKQKKKSENSKITKDKQNFKKEKIKEKQPKLADSNRVETVDKTNEVQQQNEIIQKNQKLKQIEKQIEKFQVNHQNNLKASNENQNEQEPRGHKESDDILVKRQKIKEEQQKQYLKRKQDNEALKRKQEQARTQDKATLNLVKIKQFSQLTILDPTLENKKKESPENLQEKSELFKKKTEKKSQSVKPEKRTLFYYQQMNDHTNIFDNTDHSLDITKKIKKRLMDDESSEVSKVEEPKKPRFFFENNPSSFNSAKMFLQGPQFGINQNESFSLNELSLDRTLDQNVLPDPILSSCIFLNQFMNSTIARAFSVRSMKPQVSKLWG